MARFKSHNYKSLTAQQSQTHLFHISYLDLRYNLCKEIMKDW